MPGHTGIGTADSFAVFLDIGDKIDGRVIGHAKFTGPDMHVGFADALSQLDLGFRRQSLFVKNDYVVVVKGLVNFGKCLIIKIFKIDAEDFSA